MIMFDHIRLENHTSLQFAPADKAGYSLRGTSANKGDFAINKTMDKLRGAAQRGQIRAIPLSASADDLRDAVYQVLGQPNTKETEEALKAGKPVYTVVTTYTRVFEYDPEAKGSRAGAAEASIAGLDGDATVGNVIPS
jgi:hypothetical protein